MKTVTVIIHDIAEDGLPDTDALVGRVAFLFDGSIVSGWPLSNWPHRNKRALWEADSDVGHTRLFGDVTHWVEFPESLSRLTP